MKEQRIINFGWRANLYRNERRPGIDEQLEKVQKSQTKAARIFTDLKMLNPKSKDGSERDNYIRLRGIYRSYIAQALKVRERAIQEWRRICNEANRMAIDIEETEALEYFESHKHMLIEDTTE